MSVTGEADGRPGGGPQKVGVALVDILTGLYAANAIQAALIEREKSGLGQHIDVSLLDTQVASLANLALNYLCSGTSPGAWATPTPTSRPTRCSPAATATSSSRSATTASSAVSARCSTCPAWLTTNASPPTPPASATAPDSMPPSTRVRKRRPSSTGSKTQSRRRTLRADQQAGRSVRRAADRRTRDGGEDAAPTAGEVKLVGNPIKLARTPWPTAARRPCWDRTPKACSARSAASVTSRSRSCAMPA